MAVQDKEVKLHGVVSNLPEDLTYAEYIDLVGDQTEFTREEADDIIRRGKSLRIAIPEAIEPPVAAPIEEVVTSVVLEVEAPTAPVYMRDPDAYCKGLLERSACNSPIEHRGVEESGFCETCWYPSILNDYHEYKDLRKEGYSRNDAAAMAGIIPGPEKKRIVTYAAKTRKERADAI